MHPGLIGYPSYVLYVVLFVGLFLAVARPYWAFLFAVILFSFLQIYAANYTRTEVLGPYFNLYDALFVVAGFAMLFDRQPKNFVFPKPVVFILLLISLAFFHTAMQHRINYDVLRFTRWSLTFPLAFFIGANMVVTESRARTYIYAIIIGAVLGSVTSFFTYHAQYEVIRAGDEALRLSTAEKGLGTILLVAALQQSFFKDRGLTIRVLWAGALVLFGGCVLFGQWRAVLVGIAFTLFIAPIILGNLKNIGRAAIIGSILLLTVLVSLLIIFPNIEAKSYFARYTQLETANLSRKLEIKRELEEWSRGNWFIGRGLGFHVFLKDGYDKRIAWGHVGYTSYLAQLGIIGLLFYAFYLPIILIKASKKLYDSNDWAFHIMGLLGVIAVLMECFTGMSSSYLSATKHNYGFLMGAVWALAYWRVTVTETSAAKIDYNTQPSPLPDQPGHLTPSRQLK